MKFLAGLLGTVAVALASTLAVHSVPSSGYAGPVRVAAPATAMAGTMVTAEVTAPLAGDGTPVEVVVIAPYRTSVLAGEVARGAAVLPLPADLTTSVGSVTLVAAVGSAVDETSIEVTPGVAADPVLPLVGARSIIADGADTAMVVSIPEDAHGNPLPDGTAVEFAIRHPDGGINRQTVASRYTLAWAWLTSETTAGRSAVVAATPTSRGPAVPLLEVPGSPVPFSLELMPEAPLDADGTGRVVVSTDVLEDAHGNVVLDGTAATFTVDRGGATVAVVEADVIDGRASARVPAPGTAGSLVVRAVVAGTRSTPLGMGFARALGVGRFAASAAWEDGTMVVAAGPILGPLGELVDDGTTVELQVDGAVVATAPTVDGRATLIVAGPEQPGLIEIVVAGTAVEVAP